MPDWPTDPPHSTDGPDVPGPLNKAEATQAFEVTDPYVPPTAEPSITPEAMWGPGRHPLPVWIRFFCWIFLVLGAIVPVLIATGLLLRWPALPSLDFGSLEGQRALFGSGLILFNAVAAYGLLWRQRWGLSFGLLAGAAGLIVSLVEWWFAPARQGCNLALNLNIPIQVAFLVSLWRRRKVWPKALS